MAVDPNTPLTAAEVLAALVPLVGTGGLAGIIVAWLGYRKAQREGRGSPSIAPEAQTGLAVLYAEQASLEAAGLALERVAGSIERLNKSLDAIDGEKTERVIDEIRELRRAVQDLNVDRQGLRRR